MTGREVIDNFTIEFIGRAYFHGRHDIQNVETGNGHAGETIDTLAESRGDTVKPTAAPRSAGRRAEFMCPFPDLVADFIV